MLDDAPPFDDDDLDLRIDEPDLPSRPAIWPVFVTYLVILLTFLGVNIVAGIVLVVVMLAKGDRPHPDQVRDLMLSPWVFMTIISMSQACILVGGCGGAWLLREGWTESLGLKRPRWPWYGWPAVAIASLLPVSIATWAAEPLSHFIEPDRTIYDAAARVDWLTGPFFTLLISLAPAITEEFAFRGYMQRRLLKRWPAWLAILVTSLLFGILHMMPHAVVSAFIGGLWLGTLAWWTGSVWPGVVCHAFINAWATFWAIGHSAGLVPEDPSGATMVAVNVVGGAALCLWLWMMSRQPAIVAGAMGLCEHCSDSLLPKEGSHHGAQAPAVGQAITAHSGLMRRAWRSDYPQEGGETLYQCQGCSTWWGHIVWTCVPEEDLVRHNVESVDAWVAQRQFGKAVTTGE
jgi:membrane protease YdiL (CAAX protease family)